MHAQKPNFELRKIDASSPHLFSHTEVGRDAACAALMGDSEAIPAFDPAEGVEGLQRRLTKSQQMLNVRGPWPPDMRKTFTRRRRKKDGDETAESMLERIERDIAKYHVRRSLGALHTLACIALGVVVSALARVHAVV